MIELIMVQAVKQRAKAQSFHLDEEAILTPFVSY
jgi:hypothetical protein